MEGEILEIDHGLNNTHIINARQSIEESNTDNDLLLTNPFLSIETTLV